MIREHILDQTIPRASIDHEMAYHEWEEDQFDCPGCHDRAHRIFGYDMQPFWVEAEDHKELLQDSGLVEINPAPDYSIWHRWLQKYHAKNDIKNCPDYEIWDMNTKQ